MNRCLASSRFRSLLLTFCLGLSPLALVAQVQTAVEPSEAALRNLPPDAQRIPPISAKSQYGVLRVVAPPEVLVNGKPARLSPGSRIRGTNNLMVMSASLVGQDLKVRYTLEPLGLVHEVWILTPREIAATPPAQTKPATN
jgi:hypothetical protein